MNAARILVILAAFIVSTAVVTVCYIAVVALVHGHPELIAESYRNYSSWSAIRDGFFFMMKVVSIPGLVLVACAELLRKQGVMFYVGAGLLAGLAVYAAAIFQTGAPADFRAAYGAVHMLVLGMMWGIAYWLIAGRATGTAR